MTQKQQKIKLQLIDSLQKAGRLQEAFNVHDCGSKWMHLGCARDDYDCECTIVVPWFCNHRLCPVCQKRRSALVKRNLKASYKLLKNFETGRDYHSVKVRMITLTVKNPDFINREYYQWLKDCLTKLRRSKLFRENVLGGHYVIETTRNKERNSWHPHVHMMVASKFIRQVELKKLWQRITKHSYIVGITLADPGTINEIGKYVTKSTDFLHDPFAVDEFLKAVKGLRLSHSFGAIYNLKSDEEATACLCPKCGFNEWYLKELISDDQRRELVRTSGAFLAKWGKGSLKYESYEFCHHTGKFRRFEWIYKESSKSFIKQKEEAWPINEKNMSSLQC